ncbi:MAG: DUF4326 domain-containing protein [Elusimicrobia bacterium]|nr:DUF4326 domain-containing protein [Elusimicrobiota bacterium]
MLYSGCFTYASSKSVPNKRHDASIDLANFDRDAARTSRQLHARLHELYGRDLACWCSASRPCHADVLLELANS